VNKLARPCWNCRIRSEKIVFEITGVEYCTSCGASQECSVTDRAIVEFIVENIYVSQEAS